MRVQLLLSQQRIDNHFALHVYLIGLIICSLSFCP
jgi:hypothetical protein